MGAPFLAVVTGDLNSSCRSLSWFGGFPGLAASFPNSGHMPFLPGLLPRWGTPSPPGPSRPSAAPCLALSRMSARRGLSPSCLGFQFIPSGPLAPPGQAQGLPSCLYPWEVPQWATPCTQHFPSTCFVPGLGKPLESGQKPAPDFSYGKRGRDPKEASVPRSSCIFSRACGSCSLPEPRWPHLSLAVGGSPLCSHL